LEGKLKEGRIWSKDLKGLEPKNFLTKGKKYGIGILRKNPKSCQIPKRRKFLKGKGVKTKF